MPTTQSVLPKRIYPAKLLLFGEYTVLHGSGALAIPFPHFYGTWDQNSQKAVKYHSIFEEFVRYLQKSKNLHPYIDIEFQKMKNAFDRGVYLKTNIPQGCGLGSSGALCAAVVDAFGLNSSKNIQERQKQFQVMESFFHGKSSGLDPLVSFYTKKILLRDNRLQFIDTEFREKSPTIHAYLYHSGIERNTSKLVPVFEKSMKEPGFRKAVIENYIPRVNLAISKYIRGDAVELLGEIKMISSLQLELFEPMIPDFIRKKWRVGLERQEYYFKLCGAGGGGYFYVFSDRKEPMSHTGEKHLQITSSLFS